MRTLLLGAVYAVVGVFGLRIAPVHLFASLVWPPTGIALAALLLGGTELWPGVALGAFLVNAWTGAPALVAAGISAGNTLEALVGAHLVCRASERAWSLDRLRTALAFIALGALASTAVSATLGVASLFAGGLVPRGDLGETWRVWWLGDAVGALVVGSLLLAFRKPARRWLPARRRPEAALLAASVIAATLGVFLSAPRAAATGFVEASLLIPLLLWAALRFEVRGATAAVLLASAIAIAGTALGRGPFAGGSPSHALLHLQAFMAIVSAAALVVGALTAERERAEETLRDADRRKSEFLGVLSHELRNPLGPIRNALHILRRAPDRSERAGAALAVAERQTGQLMRLVDDLLDVTRVSRGKIQLRRARVELGDLVRRVVEDHRTEFDRRAIAVRVEGGPGPLSIDADAARIAQVVGNLLQNAAKFTDAGGHVAVSVERAGGAQARVRVADDGIGIDPRILPSLFQPFTQADQSLDRSSGGLGLGLALVRALVEMHGGRVEARSAGPGRGAEFVVSLPLVEDARDDAAREERRAAPRRRILVIEDNLDAAAMLSEALALDDHEVAVAHDGEEGLAKVGTFRPDVVICDIGLPGVDGYEVARRIRAGGAASPTLIALTGYALPEDRARALEAGFDRHLAKPFDIAALGRVLATT